MVGNEKIKKAVIATLLTILLATTAYATTWYYITTKQGGYIYTTSTIGGEVLYSSDNDTWISGDMTFDQTNKLYVAFNVTHISPSSVGSLFNFTFRLFNYTGSPNTGSNVTSVSVNQTISEFTMVYCPEELSGYLEIGNTYIVYVDIYKQI